MSLEEFTAFFKYKSFDVLSHGSFKKHITQCKESGDLWAIDMHTKQNKIQYCIKQIHSKIANIGKCKLGIACKNVINCAQPPIRIFLGFSTCFITGIHSDKCLDMSKNGKKSQEIHIHPKFAYFFMFIWYICKLEYVIRACGKKWIESTHKKKNGGSIDNKMFDQYMDENEKLCKELYSIFEKAVHYVHVSLDLYNQEFIIQPMISEECMGFEKAVITLDANKEIYAEEILDHIRHLRHPQWLLFDGIYLNLDNHSKTELACDIVATHHNTFVYNHINDDGWNEETRIMQERAEEHMQDKSDNSESEENEVEVYS